MAQIVGVHGIWQQTYEPEVLLAEWWPPLRDGLARLGGPAEPSIEIVSYTELFRRRAEDARPQLNGWQRALARRYLAGAGEAIPEEDDALLAALHAVRDPDGPRLDAFLAGAHLDQVYRYFHEPGIRQAARARLVDAIGPDTRVVLAHSLGTVVAYEALCSLPDAQTRGLDLITLGSPLGVPELIFDRLDPEPQELLGHRFGASPGVARWSNLSAPGDAVALVKSLDRPLFDHDVHDVSVDNGRLRENPHAVAAYLSTEATARAVIEGLRPR